MRQDTFVEVMREVVRELIERAIMSDSEREPATKRDHADVEHAAFKGEEPASSRARMSEVPSVQEMVQS